MSLERLKKTLLAIGGERMDNRPQCDLDLLLSEGRLFPAERPKKVFGRIHRCHRNAALYYARHHVLGSKGTCEIVTGYGLHEGSWSQHSWCWDGNRVLETNANFEKYFGAILSPFHATKSVFCEVFRHLPGFATVTGRGA